MSKFSVKKPFTILVMVLIIIMLGGVSLSKMQMDLLPEISLPYLLVITTYPGASPEKVESTIAEPMESNLGTINGVKNVFSFSHENYCMVELEFEDDTNMDSVLVKVSTAVDTVRASLPEECGIPSIMELSTDMMASEYLAVSYEGMDMEELSKFVENNVEPVLARQQGVASISKTGVIEQTVQVELNKTKVDALNEKIANIAEGKLDDALEDINEAKQKLEDAQKELDDGKKELQDGEKELEDSVNDIQDGQKELDDAKKEFEDGKQELEDKKSETYTMLAEASEALEALKTYEAQLVSQKATLAASEAAIKAIQDKLPSDSDLKKLDDGLIQAEDGKDALEDAIEGIETIKENIDNTAISISMGTGENLTVEELISMAQISAAIGMLKESLKQAGVGDEMLAALDTTALDGLIASGIVPRTTAITYLNTYSQAMGSLISGLEDQVKALKSTISQLKKTKEALDAARQLLSQYQTEKTTIELEIKVTEGIIQGYEDKLKEMDIDYKDIEKAKMEAAAGFGSADAQMAAGEAQLESAQTQLDNAMDTIDKAREQLTSGWDSINEGQKQIDDGWDSYYDGLDEFERQKEQALKQANANQLISLQALSGLIYAQNFEMPAGYIDDKDANSWLLKIGNNFENIDEMKEMVLCNIDDVGDVKLGDVADLTIIDNSNESYTRLNGGRAVILSVFKASTSGTNEVSKVCNKAIAKLEEEYEGLDILVMMDQGDYIDIIVSNVVSNMVIGAALAIFILAIFLKDFLPTLVVAISIPLSVLTALVCMYFSNISLNMMSLSGMALGIGMLVDNSIVVIENVYRLRGRGVEAPRAAVQGTKQVAGAVIASTLTTVCVFAPMVYTTGLVRELMLPMSLTIIFCLLGSLFIAMTVVPAASSTLLRKTKPKDHSLFDKIQDAYGNVLAFFLKVKIVPLTLAFGLLAFSVWMVLRMGIVIIPDMTSNQIQISASFEDDVTREDAYAKMDGFIAKAQNIQGIGSIGVMTGGSGALIASAGNEDNYSSYSVMVKTEDSEAGADEVHRICDELQAAADEIGVEISISTGMGEMGSMLGSGVKISIYGDDLEQLIAISNDIMNMVDSIEGYTEISNGQEEADQVLHLNINKDYAMSKGLSVAQIYQDIAGKMTTSAKAVTVTINGTEMNVEIVNALEPVTVENIMDITFEINETDEDGKQITKDVPLSDFAAIEKQDGFSDISRQNQTRYIDVTATVEDGYNATLLSRDLQPLLDNYKIPEGYSIDVGGESDSVNEMVEQMMLLMLMGIAFIYLVMVAQFQSLLSPFIVLFTLPLAFTGGLLTLWLTGEQISIIAMMGFVVLLGTVVNNGIVFVDYTNQLRMGGMERRDALIATGKTRMRPILMTAVTTILAEASMIFGDDMGSQMGKGMALVIAGGLAYSTLMTLFIIPVMYDILFKKQPLAVDIGSENLDDVPDDAQEFMQEMLAKQGIPLGKPKAVTVDGSDSDE